VLGAILGDIVGSFYEFAHWKKRDFDPFFHPKADFTDDTVMTVAVAEALLDRIDPATALRAWARRYPGRGYGGMFRRWIARDDIGPYGSYGNGAAMRVNSAGLLGRTLGEVLDMARRVTVITHDHPEGVKGALAVAHAIFLARQGADAKAIRTAITEEYCYDLSRDVGQIRQAYGFAESCQETVPEALTCALAADRFEDAVRDAVSLGGDADTVGAIAGGLAEARFGIPEPMAQAAWNYLPREMRAVLVRTYEAAQHPASKDQPG
jgi:ADP-ribosylglycohydrolase